MKKKDFEIIEKRETLSFHFPPEAFRSLMRQLAETAKEDVQKVEEMLDKEPNNDRKGEIEQLLKGRRTLQYLYEDAVTLAEWAQSKMQKIKD